MAIITENKVWKLANLMNIARIPCLYEAKIYYYNDLYYPSNSNHKCVFYITEDHDKMLKFVEIAHERMPPNYPTAEMPIFLREKPLNHEDMKHKLIPTKNEEENLTVEEVFQRIQRHYAINRMNTNKKEP